MMHLAFRSLSRWLNGRTRTATRTESPDIARPAASSRQPGSSGLTDRLSLAAPTAAVVERSVTSLLPAAGGCTYGTRTGAAHPRRSDPFPARI
jgi:hypothetical protein